MTSTDNSQNTFGDPKAGAQNEPPKTVTAPAAKTTAAALRDIQNETTTKVLEYVKELQESGDLVLPPNYAVGNQLKLAWLNLLEVKDKNEKPALEVCTRESIANAMLEMALQGLSIVKKQCAFIVRGNKLCCDLEYHGTIALAKRLGGVVGTPTGTVIYSGDKFVYTIDPKTGKKYVIEHAQEFENIDPNKITGAYAILQLSDGSIHTEIMTMAQIKLAWMQGATKGQSKAHINFPDQMCIKTVIGRACKLYITSSDDSGLYQTALNNIGDGAEQIISIDEAQTPKVLDMNNPPFEKE